MSRHVAHGVVWFPESVKVRVLDLMKAQSSAARSVNQVNMASNTPQDEQSGSPAESINPDLLRMKIKLQDAYRRIDSLSDQINVIIKERSKYTERKTRLLKTKLRNLRRSVQSAQNILTKAVTEEE